MRTVLLALQFFSAASVIVTVLLHSAKGEGLGGIGGQARIFGSPKGLEEGLDKITAICAAIFITLSIILGITNA